MSGVEGVNPVVPTPWELLVGGLAALILALLIWAVIALARTRLVSASERLGLLAACLVLPVIGPVATLVLLHRLKRVAAGRRAGSPSASPG